MAKEIIADAQQMQMPTLAIGDFNATYRDAESYHKDGYVKFVRTIAQAGMRLMKDNDRSLIRSFLPRVYEMTDGGTMREFMDNGFVDADPRHRSTATAKQRGLEGPPVPPFRILPVDHAVVNDKLRTSDFRIHRHAGSDHRLISLTVERV
jgi:endonuclease/exonuclease/phosphatase family metal-dependent hydrolase